MSNLTNKIKSLGKIARSFNQLKNNSISDGNYKNMSDFINDNKIKCDDLSINKRFIKYTKLEKTISNEEHNNFVYDYYINNFNYLIIFTVSYEDNTLRIVYKHDVNDLNFTSGLLYSETISNITRRLGFSISGGSNLLNMKILPDKKILIVTISNIILYFEFKETEESGNISSLSLKKTNIMYLLDINNYTYIDIYVKNNISYFSGIYYDSTKSNYNLLINNNNDKLANIIINDDNNNILENTQNIKYCNQHFFILSNYNINILLHDQNLSFGKLSEKITKITLKDYFNGMTNNLTETNIMDIRYIDYKYIIITCLYITVDSNKKSYLIYLELDFNLRVTHSKSIINDLIDDIYIYKKINNNILFFTLYNSYIDPNKSTYNLSLFNSKKIENQIKIDKIANIINDDDSFAVDKKINNIAISNDGKCIYILSKIINRSTDINKEKLIVKLIKF